MHRAHQAQAVKIYRAEITSRPTRGSEIFGERRFGFPGLEAPLALFPLHVLIGSALSTIGGYTHVRAQKSLKFFFFVSGRDGRGAMPAFRQARSPVPMSPPSEQVEKTSKFFKTLSRQVYYKFLRLSSVG